ncbi:Neutral trehalase [Pseudoloma neurophilia]|uniref:Trehalase n=1 Tax=Pseudoloma neurophilia TaxID=146866 RepID=A0A0R0M3N1_9MICR|nr:Neutral trehalase [Pseudoloma neurophilia]
MFNIFLFVLRIFTSTDDTVSNVLDWLEFDVFLVGSILLSDQEKSSYSLLEQPSLFSIQQLNHKKKQLFQKYNIPFYDVSQHVTEDEKPSYLYNYVQKIKSLNNTNEIMKAIKDFIETNYVKSDNLEVTNFTYEEFNQECTLLPELKNNVLIDITDALHKRWTVLSKVDLKSEVKTTSKLHLNHPFIVPGGRFQEFFYWDTWFFLEGLVETGCKEAAFNMVKNVCDMIKIHGKMPNGTRKYYLNRSQPPFFCKMLESLLTFNDKEINDFVLDTGLKCAIQEMEYFESKKTVRFEYNGKEVAMFRYFVDTDYFRLESSRDDIQTWLKAIKINDDTSYGFQKRIFSCLKSSAESGIDFSNRWFEKNGKIETIQSIDFICVDLNSLIYNNYLFLSNLLNQAGDKSKSQEYKMKAQTLKENINDILWSTEKKCWFDYNFAKKQLHTGLFRPSNFYPCFFGIDPPDIDVKVMILEYADEIFGYVGGIPASSKLDIPHNQQWDFPNVWAPYNYLFYNLFTNRIPSKEMAFHVAKCFYDSVKSNFESKNRIFYEKYSCVETGSIGGGGEYETQDGFGWTNGATLCFIKRFKDELEDKNFSQEESKQAIKKFLEDELRKQAMPADQAKPSEQAMQMEEIIPEKIGMTS